MSSPHGNLTGLKPNQLRRLEHVYRRRVSEDAIISWELARFCTGLSHEIGRQIGVLINRRGAIEDVIVGNDREVVLPDLSGYRLGRRSLRGIRLVHTHLRDEPLSQDDLTDLALLRLDLIAAIGVKVDVRGVTRHGFALNVNPDMEYWDGIVACGLSEYPVASLADLLSPVPSMERVKAEVTAAFRAEFEWDGTKPA